MSMDINPKKSLGQNFLQDKNILNLIVDKSKISQDDTVIEIGPGTGNLTKMIVNKNPKKLIIFEKDKKLYDKLNYMFKDNIDIRNGDFLLYDDHNLKYDNLIVIGNLPYNISSQILIKLIKSSQNNIKFKRLILMFQKEVADRILAEVNSKSYGRLSIISQWKMDIRKIKDVSPKCFFPKPNVMSSIVEFIPKKDFFKIKSVDTLEYVTEIFFRYRRKMIKKPFKILFKESEEVALKLNLDLKLRPQKIEPNTFFEICKKYEELA